MFWWSGSWDAQGGRLLRALRMRTAHGGSGRARLPMAQIFGYKNFREVDPGRRSAGTPIMGGARPPTAHVIRESSKHPCHSGARIMSSAQARTGGAPG